MLDGARRAGCTQGQQSKAYMGHMSSLHMMQPPQAYGGHAARTRDVVDVLAQPRGRGRAHALPSRLRPAAQHLCRTRSVCCQERVRLLIQADTGRT